MHYYMEVMVDKSNFIDHVPWWFIATSFFFVIIFSACLNILIVLTSQGSQTMIGALNACIVSLSICGLLLGVVTPALLLTQIGWPDNVSGYGCRVTMNSSCVCLFHVVVVVVVVDVVVIVNVSLMFVYPVLGFSGFGLMMTSTWSSCMHTLIPCVLSRREAGDF